MPLNTFLQNLTKMISPEITCSQYQKFFGGFKYRPPSQFLRKQKSAEPKFVFVTKKKDESTILQMGSGNSLSVIPAVPVQYMPNVEVWIKNIV